MSSTYRPLLSIHATWSVGRISLRNKSNDLLRYAVVRRVSSNSNTTPGGRAFGTSLRALQASQNQTPPPNSSTSATQPNAGHSDNTPEQPRVEAFEGPSQPRQYYERPQPRDLPRIKRKWPVFLGFAVLGLASWAAFLTYATNQEKISSSIFRSICRSVRSDPAVKEVLGEAIRPQPEWWLNGDPFVRGQIGQLQGNIDVCFRVKGSKGAGTVYFTSIRTEKGMPFTTLRFKVIADDGTVLKIQN
ncbi:Cytochrome oxidase complex assembly protein 1 domain containing protein [Amanita muscaria]